ncbi:Clp protease ClpP [Chryseobacterium sp. SNU WT5]|uniref:Clp protease ClpP n=1 Tax=Chryseobacterium sp. SNU WT5 TaxID=2594269 RepID=UPI00118066FF|nr:Clp protease ClpP [Chryseobacterium sp. SNU WT5]QDP86077.1 Clp protease ClpP [Chryseobacterium sp. SNU WT5]
MKKLPIFNYHIENKSADRLDVFIDGTIVDAETKEWLSEWYNEHSSVSFKSFRNEVISSGIKNIRITINSFGGQIGDAMAMHDFIQQLENDGYDIETIGIGMVCSAATYILSASKNSKISKNAYYMIHNVSGGVWGDVNDIEKYAQSLRKFNNNIRDFYSNLTGKTADEIENWMNEETWFYGKEVTDNGFVKETIGESNVSNAINKNDWAFKNQNPLNVYNSFVNKPSNENLIQNLDMKNLATLIGVAVSNAFSNHIVTPKPAEGAEGATPEPVTNEALTNVITNALAEIKFDEHITNAVIEMFKDGLPENMVTQITDAVKPAEAAPLNLAENEDYKGLINRVSEVEKKILNGVGAVQPPKNEDNEKYAGVSFD